MSPGGSRAPCCPRLVVRACADTRARTNKGAGGSEGARARVDMAAQVAISGDRANSGVAGAGVNGRNQAVYGCLDRFGMVNQIVTFCDAS